MAATAQYTCLNCSGTFTARKADRDRGWARYCGKSCKAKRQEARTGQHAEFNRRFADRVAADDLDYDHAGEIGGGWDEHKDWRF